MSLLQSCLEKLKAEADALKLQELCITIQEGLDNLEITKSVLQTEGVDPEKTLADKFWEPFKVCLLPSQPTKVRQVALECLQKLVAHHKLRGALPGIIEPLPSLFKRLSEATLTVKESMNEGCLLQNTFLMDEIIHSVSYTVNEDAHIQLCALQFYLTAITSTDCEVHEKSLIKLLSTCFSIHLDTKSTTNTVTSKAILTQIINSIVSCMERQSLFIDEAIENGTPIDQKKFPPLEAGSPQEPATPNFAENNPYNPSLSFYMDLLKRDVYLMIKFLCSMALYTDAKATSFGDLSPVALKARHLAMELLLSVLTNAGRILRSDVLFLQIVKEDIITAVSRNAISTDPVLFELSISVFLMLIRHYREPLKVEIHVLLNNVFLQILELGNSSVKQKSLVLEGLSKLCQNPQMLADIYVNYDCDMEMSSVFETMTNICTRLAQKKPHEKTKENDKHLQVLALSVLTSSVESIAAWSLDQVKEAESPDSMNPIVLVNRKPLETVTLQDSSERLKTNASPAPSELDTQDIAQIASRKQQLKKAIQLFNTKPKKGLALFIELNFCGKEPGEIAEFLHNQQELAKASIGEILGEGDADKIKVLHAFVDQMDFTSLPFVTALRQFLQAFRLPGEAQKIDRIMEKFADRYCENNPTIFANADTAYTLAFSVIMLNTDQHSKQIKHRMVKADFLKNNRGINDNGDLPDDFLGDIFDNISNEEIIMEEEHTKKIAELTKGWMDDKQRMELFQKEAVVMQKKSDMLMNSQKAANSFRSAQGKELAHPMFALIAWPFMATFSLFFEKESEETFDVCLQGFGHCIQLACVFGMETERDAYINCLCKLSGVHQLNSLKPKNIKIIKMIIDFAGKLGQHLDTSWVHVLKVISQLERFQTLLAEPKLPAHIKEFAEELQTQASVILIDKIFSNTLNFSGSAILHFFKALCSCSLEEVGLHSSTTSHIPRKYLMQKIVEVAHYNMHRIRFEWTQIWKVLQSYFNAVACHPNLGVSTFAVDSLRQLGMKFLEKEELGHFSSQHEFLKSFEWIIKHNQSRQIQELILGSVSQMITAKADSIRSGWRSMFVVVVKASNSDEKLAKTSFGILQMVYKSYFDDIITTGVFVDYASSLAEFALIPGEGPLHDELVMGSIQLLQSCTKAMHEKSNGEKISQEQFYLTWFPILSAFSRIIIESEGVLLRTHTMETLFETMRIAGHEFEPSYWKAIHRNCLGPIFEDLCEQDASTSKEASSVVLILGLRLLVELISTHFDDLFMKATAIDPSAVEFLSSSLSMMITMMGKKDDKLPLSGQLCFSQFLFNNVQKLAQLDSWDWLVEKIQKAFETTLPLELLNCELPCIMQIEQPNEREDPITPLQDGQRVSISRIIPTESILFTAKSIASSLGPLMPLEQLDFEHTIIKCVTHLELIQTARQFCLTPVNNVPVIAIISDQDRSTLLYCMYQSYVIARSFNSLIDLRQAILRKGWVTKLPNLVKQEALSLASYLTLLFAAYKVLGDDLSQTPLFVGASGGVVQELIEKSMDLLDRYGELLQDIQKNHRDIELWSPVVLLIYKELLSIESWWDQTDTTHHLLRVELSRYFRRAIKMMNVNRPEIRNALQEFMAKVGDDFLKE